MNAETLGKLVIRDHLATEWMALVAEVQTIMISDPEPEVSSHLFVLSVRWV